MMDSETCCSMEEEVKSSANFQIVFDRCYILEIELKQIGSESSPGFGTCMVSKG